MLSKLWAMKAMGNIPEKQVEQTNSCDFYGRTKVHNPTYMLSMSYILFQENENSPKVLNCNFAILTAI